MGADYSRVWPDVIAENAEKPAAKGYHLTTIVKGRYGESSKIREECEEFLDAVQQGNSVMALLELSDLYGAIEGYLAKQHPTIDMEAIKRMHLATKRAFIAGQRVDND